MNQNFLLHFKKKMDNTTNDELELVVRGGERDPLEGMFSTEFVNHYDCNMQDPDTPDQPRYDFVVDDHQRIVRDKSDGKRDEIHSICLLPIRLWVY